MICSHTLSVTQGDRALISWSVTNVNISSHRMLPCRPCFLRHFSSIMEWFHRLAGWPFDGTHRLISPPSARQVMGQTGWLGGVLGTWMLRVHPSSVHVQGIWMRTRIVSHFRTRTTLPPDNLHVAPLMCSIGSRVSFNLRWHCFASQLTGSV